MMASREDWFSLSSGWERLVSISKRLGTVGFHFQPVGNGWFSLWLFPNSPNRVVQNFAPELWKIQVLENPHFLWEQQMWPV